jgi:TPR repeat protein
MGLSAAQYRLGHIYEHGIYNIRVNLTKASTYYELAANTNNNVYAMLSLSRLYNQGVQIPPEQLEDQIAIFERDESGWIKTRPRDEDAAFKWCHFAADQGLPDACYLLG